MGRTIEQAIQTEDDWDGYLAAATTAKAIEIANYASWVPTVNGGLQWEIHSSGWHIEVEVLGDGTIEVYVANDARGIEFEPGPERNT